MNRRPFGGDAADLQRLGVAALAGGEGRNLPKGYAETRLTVGLTRAPLALVAAVDISSEVESKQALIGDWS